MSENRVQPVWEAKSLAALEGEHEEGRDAVGKEPGHLEYSQAEDYQLGRRPWNEPQVAKQTRQQRAFG